MTKMQKIIGSSVISLLLLAVTMFSMCSVRMEKLNTDGDIDDLAFEEFEEDDEAYQDDLLSRLEVLDGEEAANTNAGSTEFEDDIFAALGGDDFSETPNTKQAGGGEAESFLTPELMESLQAEVNDLQNIYDSKERTADSLRQKVRETEFSGAASSGQRQTEQFVDESIDDLNLPSLSSSTRSFSSDITSSQPSYMDTEVGAMYQDALNDYNDRRFANAIAKFREILMRGNAGNLADNCQYWIGESYFAQGRFQQALVEFEKVNIFPKENKAMDARLMTGLSLMKLGQAQQARNEFSLLTIFYRNASAAAKARRYLSTLEGV